MQPRSACKPGCRFLGGRCAAQSQSVARETTAQRRRAQPAGEEAERGVDPAERLSLSSGRSAEYYGKSVVGHKHLLVHAAAREKILRGVSALVDAMRVTLGPKSKCVLIEKKWGRPLVCNDGVTIAKEFELKDPEENLGAQVIRQAAERTGDLVGDGTTTSTLIVAAIFAEGVKNIAAGASAVELKHGLDRGLKIVIDHPRRCPDP